MIVGRWTYSAKMGKLYELLELFRKRGERIGAGMPWRLQWCQVGTVWNVALEIEFESYAAYEKLSEQAYTGPEFEAFMEKLIPLLGAPFVHTIWRKVV